MDDKNPGGVGMEVGDFKLQEPVPKLNEPHMFVALRPWINVGSVGTLVLAFLERQYGAKELGSLHQPGSFYDFTRYRPMSYFVDGQRHIEVPNSNLRYAQVPDGRDLVFLHALEPHLYGEKFVESVLGVVECLGIRRYCQLGSMYGSGPHTRPLSVTGHSSDEQLQKQLEEINVKTSTYEGPTSITVLVSGEARARNIDTLHLMVQLPPYARLEEDYRGQEIILQLLDRLYGFGLNLDQVAAQGNRQYEQLNQLVQTDTRVQDIVRQLEEEHDNRASGSAPRLSSLLTPEMELFLRNLETGNNSLP